LFCVSSIPPAIRCRPLIGDGLSVYVLWSDGENGYAYCDILVERVEEGKEAQEDAKAQFASMFEEFVAVSNVELGDLKTAYERLQDSFEWSEKRAKAVWDRIDSIRGFSKALFKEWESKLGQYTNQDLGQSSQDQMNQTKILDLKLIGAMEGVAEKMDSVLDAFRDQTLFLKHNLNAQAIAAKNETLSQCVVRWTL